MAAVILVPLVVLVVGALVYALAANGKLSEMGRIAFFCGLFVLVWELARTVVHLP